MVEAEDLQTVEAEMEEGTGHRESHQAEEIQFLQGQTCHPTYDLFPAPTI